MQWIAEIEQPVPRKLIIEQQHLTSTSPGHPDMEGFYVYVWENGRGIADHLQDSLQLAKEFSEEFYDVPLDAWRQLETWEEEKI